MAKDRGWSWLVLLAVSVAQLLSLGQVLSFGIFFLEILDEFHCTRGEAALVGSLAFGVKCFTAAPASVMQRKYGCRVVVMTGGLFSALGFLLSYFSTKLWHLYVTYSIVGLGFGCTFVPSIAAIPDYFDKYRFFASAFAPVGSAIGTFLFSPFYYYLISHYTWRGAMLILSGVALQITVCGAVMRSERKNKDISWSSSIERSLFKDGKFILLLLEALCFGGTTLTVFTMANSLVIKLGLTKSQSTRVVAVMGLCNVVGRLISSLISLSNKPSRPLMFAVSTLLCGIGAVCCALVNVWWIAAVCLGMYGFSFGGKVSQLVPVMMELFGTEKLVNAMGYYMFTVGISGILGPWAAGFLAEYTGLENAYWLAGALSLVAAMILFIIFAWQKRTKTAQLQAEKWPTNSEPPDPVARRLLNDEEGLEVSTGREGTNPNNEKSNLDLISELDSNEPTPRRGWRPAILSSGD